MSNYKTHPRSSYETIEKPRFLNPSTYERNWIRTIPDIFPDILRAPAIPYKSERDDVKIKSNRYISFARPYKGRQGLLLIGTEYRPILIDESQPDRPNVIPMRLDRESILDTWIFMVSIYPAEGYIQIEDCIVANGEQLRSSQTFKERHVYLQRFIDHIWFRDQRFQAGWQLEPANFLPLAQIATVALEVHGGYVCLMPDSPNFRLLKVLPKLSNKNVNEPSFICSPVEGKPDVYELSKSDGTLLGRASVQTLSMSQALQQKAITNKSWKVMAEWNADFEAHVIISII